MDEIQLLMITDEMITTQIETMDEIQIMDEIIHDQDQVEVDDLQEINVNMVIIHRVTMIKVVVNQ
jgi:DNA polymerase III epsilon subunit-like protein